MSWVPVTAALGSALAARGFNIRLPLSEEAFDDACAPVAPALTLRALLTREETVAANVLGALIIGNGGPEMFRRFREAPEGADGRPQPLDRFTRREITGAADQTLGRAGIAHEIFFPFTDSVPALPFQRLGRAAGLGAPGPLGLQIHPEFGPWWAYRGLIAIGEATGDATEETTEDTTTTAAPLGDGCAGCPAPCVAACPAGAVRLTGFSVAACHARRLTAPACHLSCDARIRCIRGVAHRYTDEQLGFHMAASMPARRP